MYFLCADRIKDKSTATTKYAMFNLPNSPLLKLLEGDSTCVDTIRRVMRYNPNWITRAYNGVNTEVEKYEKLLKKDNAFITSDSFDNLSDGTSFCET